MSESITEPTAPTAASPADCPSEVPAPVAVPPSRLAIAIPTSLILLLAFMLASFPARNSDVWRHLATGRALLAGTYTFGSDPFAYTTDDATWVNHAWLYDAMTYGLHQIVGPFVVIVKAMLVVALAAFMLLAARPTARPWTASFSIALALVVLGPYLTLDPAIVSYGLFAFTLGWLDRSTGTPPVDRPLGAHWPLFLAMLLWVNCDEWFVLGPLTVGVFWLGTMLPRSAGQPALPGRSRRLFAVFVVSLAIGMLNPHHLRAFMLPAALDGSPHAPATLLQSLRTQSLASMPLPLAAYLLLAGLGLVSFFASAARRSWPHALVWLALLALSIYRNSAIPFFAIAAGPFLARGWQGAAVRPVPRSLARVGPAVGTMALLGLVVLACPGWLQGTREPRGWFLSVDPSLRELARQIADGRQTGLLGEHARGFNYSVDIAHYVEWFCPEHKVFIDSRPHLFPPAVVADFQHVRQALATEAASPGQGDLRPVLERWQVTHLLVADPTERTLLAALLYLWQAPQEWSLAGVAGRATLFVRRPPPGAPPSSLVPLDLARRAFDQAEARSATDHSHAQEPEPLPWWDCFVWSESAGALDRDEALVYLAHFEALRPEYRERNRLAWDGKVFASALAMTPPLPGATSPAAVASVPLMVLALDSIAAYQRSVDEGPPGSLLLAVRAARRALDADANDAVAYLRLGHAYERLHHATVEHGGATAFPLLDQMRRVQAIGALKNALRLRPDLVPAHELLVGIFLRAGALDLAWTHLQQQLRLSKAAGPRPGEAPAAFAVRIDTLAAREQSLGREVRERLNLATTKSFDLKAYGKAQVAVAHGLPGHALELLQHSPGYGEFGVEGAVLELHLLCNAGNLHEVRTWAQPEWEPVIGTLNYRWPLTLAGAATGDYDAAQTALDSLRVGTVDVARYVACYGAVQVALKRIPVGAVDLAEFNLRRVPPRTALALALGQHLLQSASRNPWEQREPSAEVVKRLIPLAFAPRQQADFHTLRGLLALEAGAIAPAQSALRAALATWNGDDGSAAIAHHYLGLMPR